MLATALGLGSLLGRPAALLHLRLLLAGGALGCVGLLFGAAISLRYQHDASPLLFVGGAIGVLRLASDRDVEPAAFALGPLLALLGLYSIWVSLAVTMTSAPSW